MTPPLWMLTIGCAALIAYCVGRRDGYQAGYTEAQQEAEELSNPRVVLPIGGITRGEKWN